MELDGTTFVVRGKEPAQPRGHGEQTRGEGPRRRSIRSWGPGAAVAAISLAIVILVAVRLWRADRPHKDTVRAEKAQPVLYMPDPVMAASSARAPFQELEGKWLRHDGGYVLQIQNVAADGKIDAAYFNPRAINVSRAEASRADPTLKVVVELGDADVPGSTYTLAYDAGTDSLVGNYVHSVMREKLQVSFARVQP